MKSSHIVIASAVMTIIVIFFVVTKDTSDQEYVPDESYEDPQNDQPIEETHDETN